MQECIKYGFAWKQRLVNFNNAASGLVSLFILSSLEGWPDRLYETIDGNDA